MGFLFAHKAIMTVVVVHLYSFSKSAAGWWESHTFVSYMSTSASLFRMVLVLISPSTPLVQTQFARYVLPTLSEADFSFPFPVGPPLPDNNYHSTSLPPPLQLVPPLHLKGRRKVVKIQNT